MLYSGRFIWIRRNALFGAFHNHKLLYALHAPPEPSADSVRAAPQPPLRCRHDSHVTTAYTGPRQSRRSVSQLFHGPTRPAFTLHPSTGSQTTCGDRIRYSGSNVWRTATRRALAALPILSATRRFPRTNAHTRANARGGGPWAPRPTPMPHVSPPRASA